MSEYQYYEFAAIDGPVTEDECPYPWSVSSRAEVTPWRWRNVYNWGDFHGSVDKMMEFYDAHVYLANWGTFRFTLAFPKDFFDATVVKPYLSESSLELVKRGDRYTLTWHREDEEPEDWQEGEGLLDRLLPIREELLRGDCRSLYLGWLADFCRSAEWEEKEEPGAGEAACEPPVPPGLGDLTPAQRELTELLMIDADYLAAAAELDVPAVDREAALRSALERLDAGVMRTYLLCVAEGGATRVMAELNRLVRSPGQSVEQRQRTRAEWVTAVKKQRLARERRTAEERDRKRRAAVAKRQAHLEALMQQAESVWGEVESLAERKTGSAYDEAVRHLRDLRDAYALAGRITEYQEKLRGFEDRNARRPALVSRIRKLQTPSASTPAAEITEDDLDDR